MGLKFSFACNNSTIFKIVSCNVFTREIFNNSLKMLKFTRICKRVGQAIFVIRVYLFLFFHGEFIIHVL